MTHSPTTATDLVADGNAALDRGDWSAARDLFTRAVAVGESPAAVEGLGSAAFFLDDAEPAFEACGRALIATA